MCSAIIFDLGGVFIKLTGVSTMLEWTAGKYTVDELWDIWFKSDNVRRFETGQSGSREFARSIIDEYGLPVDDTEFLKHFKSWSNVPFPGTRRLLTFLKQNYTLVSLSNTNKIHWNNMCERFSIDSFFHANFPSHITGKVKPERDSFEYVLNQLAVPPEQIYFFDDNPVNIQSAGSTGINAFQVAGIDELISTLMNLKIINNIPSLPGY